MASTSSIIGTSFARPLVVMKKPKLIVFDLDYTLWPFRLDKNTRPPFHKNEEGIIVDSEARELEHYEDVPHILETLSRKGYKLGIASRVENTIGAKQLLELFSLVRYFQYVEIYPGCKVAHFKKIREKSAVEFNEMLFFDDDERNIRDTSRKGITSVLVPDGVSVSAVEDGLSWFSSQDKE